MVATYKSPHREFEISDHNLIWVARGILGESGFGVSEAGASGMMWAMANRILLTNIKYPGTKRQPEYWEMWREFSQPINPQWDGIPGNEPGDEKDFCAPGGKWAGTKFCSQDKLDRRKKYSSLTWDEIPPQVVKWVRQFQHGLLFPPDEFSTKTNRSRISNWSAKSLRSRAYKGGPLVPIYEKYHWGIQLDGEWMFEDTYLKKGFSSVQSDPDGFSPTAPRSSLGYVTLGAAGVAITAYAVYTIAKML